MINRACTRLDGHEGPHNDHEYQWSAPPIDPPRQVPLVRRLRKKKAQESMTITLNMRDAAMRRAMVVLMDHCCRERDCRKGPTAEAFEKMRLELERALEVIDATYD
jgi:hypothetical protein